MPFTALATKIYRGPIDVVWANSIQGNDNYLLTGITRTWVSFDGSAATLSANASQNVSSITDSGVGLYVINYITGFANTGYIVFGSTADSGSDGSNVHIRSGTSARQTGSCQIGVLPNAGSFNDSYLTVGFVGLGN